MISIHIGSSDTLVESRTCPSLSRTTRTLHGNVGAPPSPGTSVAEPSHVIRAAAESPIWMVTDGLPRPWIESTDGDAGAVGLGGLQPTMRPQSIGMAIRAQVLVVM
jgi:hypothetical protein